MIRRMETRIDVIRNGAVLTQLYADGSPRIRAKSKSEIKSTFSGSFLLNDKVDWLQDELQPVLILDGVEYPLGIFAPATITRTQKEGKRRVSVEAYDRCWKVDSTRSSSLVHLASGTNYITAIKSLLTSCGIALVRETPCSDTLRMDREDWDVGESTLIIINQLLEEINYKKLWFDSKGIAVLEPRKDVQAANIVRTYDANNSRCLILDGMETKLDIYNAPNVFICVCSDPDTGSPMSATAENTNPASPLSIVRRGRRIATVKKLKNIASQAQLNESAKQMCNDAMLMGATATVTTMIMPDCGVDDVVALVHPDLEGVCRETEWTIDLTPGGTMQHKLERTAVSIA